MTDDIGVEERQRERQHDVRCRVLQSPLPHMARTGAAAAAAILCRPRRQVIVGNAGEGERHGDDVEQQWWQPRPLAARARRALCAGALCLAGLAAATAVLYAMSAPLSPSFGALATLLYGAPTSALAQPHNAVAGNAIGALVGVLCRTYIGVYADALLAPAIAVALTVALTHAVGVLHPPAGAVALYATLEQSVDADSALYVVLPVLVGDAALLVVAFLLNNVLVDDAFRYPTLSDRPLTAAPNEHPRNAQTLSAVGTNAKTLPLSRGFEAHALRNAIDEQHSRRKRRRRRRRRRIVDSEQGT